MVTYQEGNMAIERFVVIEGLDGNGKSTVAPLIAKHLRTHGKHARVSAEPTAGYIGKAIRAILYSQSSIPSSALPTLYAADRYFHIFDSKKGVMSYLQHDKDNWEISSRYIYSSLVYQSLESKESFIKQLNQNFPLPQFLFYIDVSPETALKRISTRARHDRFEQLETLRKVRHGYQRIIAEARQSDTAVHTINGEQPIESVANEILEQLKPHL